MDDGRRRNGARAARPTRNRGDGVGRPHRCADDALRGVARVMTFASDNWATVHPAVLAAIGRVNSGHVPPYGAAPITRDAVERIKAAFGPAAEPYFVFNGTSANVLALGSCCRQY